jgi:hypothetical protein
VNNNGGGFHDHSPVSLGHPHPGLWSLHGAFGSRAPHLVLAELKKTEQSGIPYPFFRIRPFGFRFETAKGEIRGELVVIAPLARRDLLYQIRKRNVPRISAS